MVDPRAGLGLRAGHYPGKRRSGPTIPIQVDATLAALEERLLALRMHRATLLTPPGDPYGVSGTGGAGSPAPAAGQSVNPGVAPVAGVRGATEGSVPYRYEYSFGLIGNSGRGRVVLRNEDGKLQTERYNFSEYRDDAVWVKLLFRNDGDTPQRFNGAMALGHRQAGAGLGRARVGVLATVSLSTPVLQPGEIYESDHEVRVDRVGDVDFVEVGRVRSFPPGD